MSTRPTTDPPSARSIGALVALVALSAAAFPLAAVAQETPETARIAELMERSLELGNPGPEHEALARYAGSWDMEMTMWAEPGADAVTTTGTVESRVILGGRYLEQTTTIPDGFFAGESISILGFDRRSEEYTLIGLDTIGTYWVTAQGPADGDGGAVLSGEDFDPVFGAMQIYDFVLSWPDADTFITELIFKDEAHAGGPEPHMLLRIVARRR